MPSDLTRADIEALRASAAAPIKISPCYVVELCDLALRQMDQLEHLQAEAGPDSCADLMAKHAAALAHCRAHEHPGVSPGVHEFAKRQREILEGQCQ